MKVEYSHTADALYVYFREVEAARSDDIAEGVVVDFDSQGQIVGIEILDVRSRLSDYLKIRHSTKSSFPRKRESIHFRVLRSGFQRDHPF